MKIKRFAKRWKNRGYEKGETQTFWLEFIRDVFNIQNPEDYIKFEVPVKLQHTNFIDAFLIDTNVIIEQKSLSENISSMKPYEQAQRYITGLPLSMHPRYIITCNFAEFLIYDMETLGEPLKILLEDLPQKFDAFKFLVDKEKTKIRIELEISLKAGEIVGKIYDALKSQYVNPDSDESLQSLNKLCVRLVFCLYAESTGIFNKRKIFRDYLENSRNVRRDLLDLFDVLNTPENLRDPYLADELKIFPYVNGGLFADENIEIPNFTPEIKNLLIEEASNFNWSGISPTIFGAVFESTLNPVTRRKGGMHYTSVENIHKVIDPLFMDELNAEFISCKKNRKKLLALQNKISTLKFLDPASGSGNFLTESFISLRKLENEILKELLGSQIQLGEINNPVKVSIAQFYGIEINDFAVAVAQTALWIAELQMLQQTEEIIERKLNLLPLTSSAQIIKENALTLDWQEFLPQDLNFIFGNPPFVGKTFQTREQKADMAEVFHGFKNFGNLDYVTCWYKKTYDFLRSSPKIECAFVSTNSIAQGEQAMILRDILKFKINFAYRTFRWDSESTDMAHVHCVIIGFAIFDRAQKIIFDGDNKIFAENINFYLDDAPEYFIKKRQKPLQDFIPPMRKGNMPIDNGNFFLTEDEKNILIKKFPDAEKFIKICVGGEEFLHNTKRYCLWLVDANPAEIKKIPPIYERIKKIREFRLKSSDKGTRKLAETPQFFREKNNPKNFIAIPQLSSENRKYIPMGFLDENFIPTNLLLIIPDADLYLFGILQSSLHMAFVKKFCGRLESRLRYSAQIIYNNFPFCEPTENQRQKIEQTAQKILDVRKNYPDATLADLYDELVMPADLRKAHLENDRAVMAAYGFKNSMTESEIVSALMILYKNLTPE